MTTNGTPSDDTGGDATGNDGTRDDGTAGSSAGGGHPHGGLSEEALKLAETLQTWLSTGAALTGAGTASECKVCPLCQAIAVVNSMKPEVLGHLAQAGMALASAFRAATEGSGTSAGGETRSWASSDRPPVQHITVT